MFQAEVAIRDRRAQQDADLADLIAADDDHNRGRAAMTAPGHSGFARSNG
jgi:hypothetical protein